MSTDATVSENSSPSSKDGSGRVSTTGEGASSELKSRTMTFRFGFVVVFLSVLSGFSTYLILTGLTPIVPTHNVVVSALIINAILVLGMVGIIAWQVRELWVARKQEAAGSRLHVRIVGLFSVVAVLPAILLAIFASISLDRGLDHWFSTRTKSLMEDSINIALAYVRQHGNIIRADVVGMAAALDEAAHLVKSDPKKFTDLMKSQAQLRGLPSVYLIDETGQVRAHATRDAQARYLKPPMGALKRAGDKQLVVIAPGKTNKVRALLKLRNFRETYLYVLRPVDPQVTRHLQRSRASVNEYKALQQRRTGVQVAFGLMYVAIALTLLLAAIWFGLWLANLLVSPIRGLIGAAERVSGGDLDVQLAVREEEGDLAQLNSTFNSMTSELKNQRNDLMTANSMLDHRRRFMETVLSGVTAGVIGLDREGRIDLANRSAEDLLGRDKIDLVERPVEDVVPEFAALFKELSGNPDKMLVQDHVNMFRGGSERNLAVRITREGSARQDEGFVVTFDDITELVAAQRNTAWADVARRIAHEIKNPLTPIQLSAERIRRRYGEAIGEDREVFDKCTDTIIRQVGDIGRMVDEFSHFARMPKPVMEQGDLSEAVSEAVFLFQMSHPEISFDIEVLDEPVLCLFDRRLISQAVTNLVKNASEAISARAADHEGDEPFKGFIETRVLQTDGQIEIEVMDNGVGLPQKDRNRLVEPYMTTREKGTGLGLAIVQKITEQHGGSLRLEDAPISDKRDRGACVRLTIPLVVGSSAVSELGSGEADSLEGAADIDPVPGSVQKTKDVEQENSGQGSKE